MSRLLASKPKIQRKAAYHHGDLRQQLINATRRLVEERGPAHFTVADACKLAGVSIAAPYRHFASRDDMLDEVVIDGKRRMAAMMRESLTDQARGSQQALTQLGKTYVRFAAKEPNVFRLMFKKIDDADRHSRVEAVGRETYGVLLNEVALHLGKTQIDEQVLRVALPMWTFVHGTAMLLIDGMLTVADFDVDLDAMIESVCVQLSESRLTD